MTAQKDASPATPKQPMSRGMILAGVGALVAVLFIVAVVVAGYFTSQPSFFGRYRAYQRSMSTLATSGHKNLPCDACHTTSGGSAVYRAQLVGDFYVGLWGKPSQPMFVKFGKPTREACLACHSRAWSMDSKRTSKVPHPAHLRVSSETRDCVICHKWTAHEEDYMQKHKAMPFSTVCASFECHVGFKQPNDCKNCHHQLQQSLGVWKATHPQVVRANGANGCIERCHDPQQCRTCHTTGKTPVFPGVINASTVSAIEVAHVKSDWLTQHGTFALQDQSKCLTCHVNLTECQDCHSKRPAFHGTDNTVWIGTHKNVAKDPRRCYECHQKAQCDACHQQFKEMR
jgi:hypothetical protein